MPSETKKSTRNGGAPKEANPSPPKKTTVATRFAAGFPGPNRPLNKDLGDALAELSDAFEEAPVWVLFQQGSSRHDSVNFQVRDELFRFRPDLKKCERVVLVVDSPGGIAASAYQIARLFQRHCKEFIVVVPRYAKSAATLLSLGAKTIYIGDDAQMGPLDAQVDSYEDEEYKSALDEVQALERLNASALTQVDQTMNMLVWRTGKKVQTLLPLVLGFVAESMAPLMEKIDAVHYTQQARVLKVAEDYAVRLLEANYDSTTSSRIAHDLVHGYSEHGFVIDFEELCGSPHLSALDVQKGDTNQAAAIEKLEHYLTENRVTAIGPVHEN